MNAVYHPREALKLANMNLFSSLFFWGMGSLIAMVYLLCKPTTLSIDRFLPTPKEVLKVYYPRGIRSKDSDWTKLYANLLKPTKNTAYTIRELDLNTWSIFTLKSLEDGELIDNPNFEVKWDRVPNFSVNQGYVHLVQFLQLASVHKKPLFVYQVKAKPELDQGKLHFAVRESYLGSFPLHKLPYVSELALKKYLTLAFEGYDKINIGKFKEQLHTVKQIEGQKNAIVLTF
jgi:hypothetical protein